jgi:hypothetical protein
MSREALVICFPDQAEPAWPCAIWNENVGHQPVAGCSDRDAFFATSDAGT